MKTILLTITFMMSITAVAQEKVIKKKPPYAYNDFYVYNENSKNYILIDLSQKEKKKKTTQIYKTIPYIIGSTTIEEYEIEVRFCKNDDRIVLKNGVHIAGINYIIKEKSKYIGGIIVFDGDTTKIKDILIVPIGDCSAKFTVVGKDFNMGFTLIEGEILELGDKHSVFNTKNTGVWSIFKKV